jgi:RNA polymerase sigma factor (sigma-70 family)
MRPFDRFNDLFTRLRRYLHGAADDPRLSSMKLQSELVQEAMLQCLEMRDQIPVEDSSGWRRFSRRVFRNRMIDAQRRLSIDRHVPYDSARDATSSLGAAAPAPALAVSGPGPQEQMEGEEEREAVRTALDHLAAHEREAVMLQFREGLTLAEIGERLGCSERMAGYWVCKGKQRLERLLVRAGVRR